MARHRSPRGRRAIVGSPLFAAPAAAAGTGGLRADPDPVLSFPSLPRLPSVGMLTELPLPARMAAVAVLGGAVAAAGQAAWSGALPAQSSNALHAGLVELTAGAAHVVADPADRAVADLGDRKVRVAVAPVAPAVSGAQIAVGAVPEVASVTKAADLHAAAAAAAEKAAADALAATRAAEAEAARKKEELARVGASASAAGGIQMLVGRVTSGFGARGGTSHMGLDIAAPIGTPIHVPLGGTVISSGPASGFGLWVRVQHDDGTITVYGHINRSLVSVGQRVQTGQVIAEVGNRGESTGPHLHIEVITPGGAKINPKPWLDQRGIGYT
ncbi:hypothetical protein GCM10009836_31410 [Pseudonocardia ailaonensis]|uniref:M23ase beta-sheet core domain-containing protein n=1 Tax=Pseudonocardia ailaonensis TaxID=367279 RepID=A0ABN2N2U4_9PSEU